MRVLDGTAGGDLAARFTADLERAMLAHALAELGTLPDERVKALLRDWLIGTFNPRAAALDSDGDDRGMLAWQPDGSGYAGKIMAVLVRQHHRDLFDSRDLQANEGIGEDLHRAVLVYAGQSRQGRDP